MKKLVILLVGLIFSVTCFAQVVASKGVGTASYGWSLSSGDKEKAYRAAQVSAVERYFAEAGEAEAENFEAIQPKVEENLDKFLLSTTIINEQNQESAKKYSVSVRVEINVAKLRNALRGSSATAKATASGAEKSQLVYVFIGREAASVRSYDARVVQRVEVSDDRSVEHSASVKGNEGEKISGGNVGTSASRSGKANANFKRSVSVEKGGSTTRKADETSYRLLQMNNYKTSITSVFSQGGFNVADPEFVLEDRELKAVNQDFSAGNDLSPSTIRSVVGSLRKNQIPYLVLATLDVGAPLEDPATGMQRVAVSVTARVLDISGNLPREVASVPAVQYAGLGVDNASAQGKALKDAAIAAAREVISRLNAAGIQ